MDAGREGWTNHAEARVAIDDPGLSPSCPVHADGVTIASVMRAAAGSSTVLVRTLTCSA